MKRLILAAGLALSLASPAFAADPVEGVWKTQVDDGAYAQITIQSCGEFICGVISDAFNEDGTQRKSENIGKTIVWNMKPEGSGAYRDGKIWRPSNGKTYGSKMDLSGKTLVVKGCLVGNLACKGQTWTRVK